MDASVLVKTTETAEMDELRACRLVPDRGGPTTACWSKAAVGARGASAEVCARYPQKRLDGVSVSNK